MYYAVKQNETYLFRNKFFLYIGYIYINFWSIWNLLIEKYGALFRKKITFLRTKYFFDAASSCFCRHEILFCPTSTLFLLVWNTFSCDSNTFSSRSDYFLCNVKLFCFSTKLFFVQHQMFALHIIWNVMLWWYFLLSHSNKNIITCQKIIKSHFYVTKKLLSFFVHHNFFIFSFYTVHW